MTVKQKSRSGLLHVFVALAQHRAESGNLALATLDFAGLLKVALGAHVTNHALAVEFLLQAAQSLFHRLALADFDFN